jgi:hypothetical protein
MNTSLVYIHIGKGLPNCLFDSLYQTLLINKDTTKIYVIIESSEISNFNDRIKTFNLNNYFSSLFEFLNIINVIPLEILQTFLDSEQSFSPYKSNVLSKVDSSFRDGFWVSTTMRFFYIHALIQLFHIENVFHIENDIMMYVPFVNIFEKTITSSNSDKVWMIKDAATRVIPSLLFFPTAKCSSNLVSFIVEITVNTPNFLNDMNILGMYPDAFYFSIFPSTDGIIYDGAAIGQYLGGIDIRNVPELNSPEAIFHNNTFGFINETSRFKPNTCWFSKSAIKTDRHTAPIKLITCKPSDDKPVNMVANLHMHSKQLYQFSSVFDTQFTDIVTGDRVVSLCDFVIATREIYNFHKNLDRFANEVLLVTDWVNVNTDKINHYFQEFCKKNKTTNIKLFVYTHILENFMNHILDKLDNKLQYTIYCHNSDHPFDAKYTRILDANHVTKVFAQNIDHPYHNKLNFLPIGLANSMWPHGDVVTLYSTMKDTYTQRKTKSIYVNINPNTFGYRRAILDGVQKTKCWDLSRSKPFKEYLNELAKHRFCFALRGNGVSSHRFWESLYLGVIPVIINNSHTQMKHFVDYLKTLDIPFFEIQEEDFDIIATKYPNEFFSEELYNQIINKLDTNMYLLKSLKLNHYV